MNNHWNWNNKLISLSDVQIYLAKRLISITDQLLLCHKIGVVSRKALTTEARNELSSCLAVVAQESEAISLPFTAVLARRVLSEIDTENLHDKISELETRFSDEIESITFFLVKPEKLKYYNNTELAGSRFKERFASVGNVELIEAGNCFVLDRYTACVFHLMRALDIALSCLQRELGIPEPSKDPDKTWGKTLSRISDKITQNNTTPTPAWLQECDFYKQAMVFLQAVKAPYRDATMHVKSSYDEASATSLLNVVSEALRYLATKLKE